MVTEHTAYGKGFIKTCSVSYVIVTASTTAVMLITCEVLHTFMSLCWTPLTLLLRDTGTTANQQWSWGNLITQHPYAFAVMMGVSEYGLLNTSCTKNRSRVPEVHESQKLPLLLRYNFVTVYNFDAGHGWSCQGQTIKVLNCSDTGDWVAQCHNDKASEGCSSTPSQVLLCNNSSQVVNTLSPLSINSIVCCVILV